MHAPAPALVGAFAVATSNVGVGGLITVSANTGGAALPLVIALCQTNPATGACTSTIGPSVTTLINAGATPTFAIFVAATGPIALDAANNRVFVIFNAGSVTRGRTSVARRSDRGASGASPILSIA